MGTNFGYDDSFGGMFDCAGPSKYIAYYVPNKFSVLIILLFFPATVMPFRQCCETSFANHQNPDQL